MIDDGIYTEAGAYQVEIFETEICVDTKNEGTVGTSTEGALQLAMSY
jgi:hypothetical protein